MNLICENNLIYKFIYFCQFTMQMNFRMNFKNKLKKYDKFSMEKILLTPHISFTSTLTLHLHYQTKQMFLQTSSTASQIKLMIFNEFIFNF